MGEAKRELEKEREGWRDTVDQSDIRCSRGSESEREKNCGGREKERERERERERRLRGLVE